MTKTPARRRLKITERALIQRLNRKLKQDGEQLRTSRSTQTEITVGRYFIVDIQRNFISTQDVDIEKLGRELGVIQAWEEVETE
jgi:hypothetical protein